MTMDEMAVTKTYSMTLETIGMASDLGVRSGLGASAVIRVAIQDLFRRVEGDPGMMAWLRQQALGGGDGDAEE